MPAWVEIETKVVAMNAMTGLIWPLLALFVGSVALPWGRSLLPMQLLTLPGGADGTAAIYADSVAATHVIRKIMIRMDAWLNYL